MKKFTLMLKFGIFPLLILLLCAFSKIDTVEEGLNYLQKTFTEHYDVEQEKNVIKRYELNVTNNGFCRYKRYYLNGKTEYFAFKMSRFKDMDYLGNTESGKLYLRTKGDDIIVQTYKDRGGDVDSMTTQIVIPFKNLQPEDLNLIKENLYKLTGKF